jgi:hypothetical protein
VLGRSVSLKRYRHIITLSHVVPPALGAALVLSGKLLARNRITHLGLELSSFEGRFDFDQRRRGIFYE